MQADSAAHKTTLLLPIQAIPETEDFGFYAPRKLSENDNESCLINRRFLD